MGTVVFTAPSRCQVRALNNKFPAAQAILSFIIIRKHSWSWISDKRGPFLSSPCRKNYFSRRGRVIPYLLWQYLRHTKIWLITIFFLEDNVQGEEKKKLLLCSFFLRLVELEAWPLCIAIVMMNELRDTASVSV